MRTGIDILMNRLHIRYWSVWRMPDICEKEIRCLIMDAVKGVWIFFCLVRRDVHLSELKQGYRNPTGFRRWVKVAKNQKLLYAHGMETWKSKNRHKYLLQYHIIFVCKYRKKLLVSRQISDDIKQFSYEICQRHSVIIRYMETDKDHIQKSRLRKRVTVDVKGI